MFFFGSSTSDKDNNRDEGDYGSVTTDSEAEDQQDGSNESGLSCGVQVLFPSLLSLLDMSPKAAFKVMKANAVVDGQLTLSELVDAFWWCMFGFLYTTEDERTTPLCLHDEYFYSNGGFRSDALKVMAIDSMRITAKTHRYPYPKKANKNKKTAWTKGFNTYHEVVHKAALSMGSGDEMFSNPEFVKMTVDMLRSQQERLLGYDPDAVTEKRQRQFKKIALMLDAIFVHRAYVERCADQECEILTPEEAFEWDSVKTDLLRFAEDDELPGFIRKMLYMKDVMVQLIPSIPQ
jgi:hypothetical protein